MEDTGAGRTVQCDQCRFMKKTLNSGFTVADLLLMASFYEFAVANVDNTEKEKGQELLDAIAMLEISTVDQRKEALKKMRDYIEANPAKDERTSACI